MKLGVFLNPGFFQPCQEGEYLGEYLGSSLRSMMLTLWLEASQKGGSKKGSILRTLKVSDHWSVIRDMKEMVILNIMDKIYFHPM